MQPSQYGYASLQYRFAVTSRSPNNIHGYLIKVSWTYLTTKPEDKFVINKHTVCPKSFYPLWIISYHQKQTRILSYCLWLSYKMGQELLDIQKSVKLKVEAKTGKTWYLIKDADGFFHSIVNRNTLLTHEVKDAICICLYLPWFLIRRKNHEKEVPWN